MTRACALRVPVMRAGSGHPRAITWGGVARAR